jgi:erythromycin esterase-like protein
VVWADNSHIGDARETAMADRGELDLGQLCRERWREEVRLVGFGTHTGRVAAASDWDGPMELKTVLPSGRDSVERLFRKRGWRASASVCDRPTTRSRPHWPSRASNASTE